MKRVHKQRLLAILLGTVGGLFAAELLIRLVVDQGDQFGFADPHVFLKHEPGASGTFVSTGPSPRHVKIAINAHGYRGPEWVKEATPKIAFIGDSFTAAFETSYEQSFVALTEARLRSEFPHVAAMNLGVRGTGTGFHTLYLEHDALPQRPAAVVLDFFVGNDFADNVVELSPSYFPHWTLEGDELRLVPPTIPLSLPVAILRGSRLAALGLRVKLGSSVDRRLSDELFKVRPDPVWTRTRQVGLALLDRFAGLCERSGVPLVIMLIPAERQIEPRTADTDDLKWDLPQRLIEAHMRGRAVVVDLLPGLRERARELHDPHWYTIPYDGHLNEAGHTYVAQVLAPILGEKLRAAVVKPGEGNR